MSAVQQDLAAELLKLLKCNESEKVSRNKCFDQFETPFGRKLFSYYRTCISIIKEIEDERRTIEIRICEGMDDSSFAVEIFNEPIRYHRMATLPAVVKPYFEKLVKSHSRKTARKPQRRAS